MGNEDLDRRHEVQRAHLHRLYPGHQEEIEDLYMQTRAAMEKDARLTTYSHILVARDVYDRLERKYGKPRRPAEENLSSVSPPVHLEHHPRWIAFIRDGLEGLMKKRVK